MKLANPILVFGRAQVAAFLGGITDYFLMIALTELVHIHYTKSIVISGSIGAVVNFLISRKWAFNTGTSYKESVKSQALKFACVAAGSIALKSMGTLLVTTLFHINYKIGRLIVDAFVSYGFNFVLLKYWVFKKKTSLG